MDNFEFWNNWKSGMNDTDFANAFTALGILAARSRPGAPPASGVSTAANDSLMENMVYDSLRSFVTSLPNTMQNPLQLPWKFPLPGHRIAVGMSEFCLSNLNPLILANTWHDLGANLPLKYQFPPMRLRIMNSPTETVIKPWLNMLLDAVPGDKSVYIDVKFPSSQIYMKWPLRLGFIPGNCAGEAIMEARKLQPSIGNSTLVEVGRETDNCDFLVFDGSTEQLLSELKSLPVAMKCNLFIFRGPAEDSHPDFHARIREIAALSYANGFVFCDEKLSANSLSIFLNKIIEELSHNLHMDSAVSKAFRDTTNSNQDILSFLSKVLADFRLEHLMDLMIRKVNMMPVSATIDIPDDVLVRLNMPSSSKVNEVSWLKSQLNDNKAFITYKSESTGATGLTEINKMMVEAVMPEEVNVARMERYISARTLQKKEEEFVDEKRAFLSGIPSKVIMRIGPPDEKWVINTTRVPIEKLPPQKEAWGLTVVLGEPTHIKEPIIRKIKLPQDGPSTECEFIFTPMEAVAFEGRITVLHRGRVIQTAVLKIPVVNEPAEMPASDQMQLVDIIPVRASLGNLEDRRQFDLAFVTNHTSGKKPVLTGIGKNQAWLSDLEACKNISVQINKILTDVAKKVEDYKDGFNSVKGSQLLWKLAICGCNLHDAIIKKRLKGKVDKKEFVKKKYLQIITTNDSDQIIPFEFIYDHEAPDNSAKICEFWKEGLGKGECQATCSKNFRETLCPLGFWGLSKVIERQDFSSEEFFKDYPDYILQSEEAVDKRSELDFSGKCLVAASKKVKPADLKAVIDTITTTVGTAPVKATNWAEWESLVQENKPRFMVALPHHEGDDIFATLEINEDTILGEQIRIKHIRKENSKDPPPIVALLGCDTVGTAMKYEGFVQKFRLRGAAIVIGTIASVFGKHAAEVANMLVKGLNDESVKNERLGEVMLSMKRKAIHDGLLMALCVVAYGDADWKLTKKGN